MRVVALGDFHGSFPQRVVRAVKKEDPNLILCVGDLPRTEAIRSLIFEHWDDLVAGTPLKDIVGQKRLDALHKAAIRSMEPILKTLDGFGVPVVLIWGNSDYVDEHHGRRFGLSLLNDRVRKYRNILFTARERSFVFGDVQVLAFSGYRFPGEKGFYEEKLKDPVFRGKVKRVNGLWQRRLKRLWSRRKRGKEVFFLCHDPPRDHLDRVRERSSPMHGKNLGDEYYLRTLKVRQPPFCVCGHMHENPGVSRLGKTRVVNVGAVHEGRFAVFEGRKVTSRKV